MNLWRENMPRGMFLKSQGFASNLSDPAATLTLEAFCRATGRPYADYGLPVPLDTFVAYGQWFQSAADLNVEEMLVTRVSPAGDGYELTLANGESRAPARWWWRSASSTSPTCPSSSPRCPPGACTHSTAHTDLSVFGGQQVIVVGAGQSALESAALLHENGASVQIVMRDGARDLERRAAGPGPSAAGSGCGSRRPALAPAGAPGSTHASRPCSGTCPSPPGSPGPDRARPGRGQLAARPGRGRVPGPDRPGAGPGGVRARRGPARPGARLRRPDRAGRGSCHRGHRLPARPEPADVPRRGAAVPAAHRGRHPRGGPRLRVQRPRAVSWSARPWRRPSARSCGSSTARITRPGPWAGGWPARAAGARTWPWGPAGERVPDRRASLGRRPGERSVRVSLGHANVPASTVSVFPEPASAAAGPLSVAQDAVGPLQVARPAAQRPGKHRAGRSRRGDAAG